MRILMFLFSLCLAVNLSAASFEELRAKVGNKGNAILPEGTFIEGIIVSDYTSLNMEGPVQVSCKEVDPGMTFRTAYIQSADGNCGFRVHFNSVYDNRFPRFSRVKMDLGGAVLT